MKVEAQWATKRPLDDFKNLLLISSIYHMEWHYSLGHHITHWSRIVEYPWALDASNLMVNDIVLDAGPGHTSFTPYIARMCKAVVGLDTDMSMISTMHPMTHRWVNYVQGSILAPPFKPESFTKIFCISVLEHMDNVEGAFMALYDLLRPGGRMLITLDVDQHNQSYMLLFLTKLGIENLIPSENDLMVNMIHANRESVTKVVLMKVDK